MGSTWKDYLIVAAIAASLGLCELWSRYRDEPYRAVINLPAIAYILINAGAGAIALLLINAWKPNFGVNPQTDVVKLHVIWILVAGLGAMAFFRSSFFTFRLGEKDVPLGPSLIMQVLLDVTDRSVDRGRAAPRALLVADVMSGIDFDKAVLALPAYCFALMQNVSKEEQSAIGQQFTTLNSSSIAPEIKSYLLGLVLLNVVGEAVLRAAVKTLKAQISSASPALPPAPSPAAGGNGPQKPTR
jgi:hypothetical protein